jgi:hypothetical protein
VRIRVRRGRKEDGVVKHHVYIAAPSECRKRAQAIAEAIVAKRSNVEIVSRWHTADVEKYPSDPSERASAVAANVSDIMRADTFVLLTDAGTPRSAWVELGIAIAQKTFIVWIRGDAPEQRTIFDAHGAVTLATAGAELPPETAAWLVVNFIKEAA